MIEYKRKLRSQLRDRYKSLNMTRTESVDLRLIQRLMGHDLYKNSSRVFLYASVGTEINTRELISMAFAEGKTVALPKCKQGGVMDFYAYNGTLTEGRYGIPEPDSDEILYPETDDVMIVPGLAFDEKGYRVGQGGGYYDRYLERFKCITVGLCRDEFIQKEVPVCWNDLPVDYVITETRVYECKNGASAEAPSS